MIGLRKVPLAYVSGSSKHGVMMLVKEVLLAARPALTAILTSDELTYTRVDVVTTNDERVMSWSSLRENLLLRVVMKSYRIIH